MSCRVTPGPGISPGPWAARPLTKIATCRRAVRAVGAGRQRLGDKRAEHDDIGCVHGSADAVIGVPALDELVEAAVDLLPRPHGAAGGQRRRAVQRQNGSPAMARVRVRNSATESSPAAPAASTSSRIWLAGRRRGARGPAARPRGRRSCGRACRRRRQPPRRSWRAAVTPSRSMPPQPRPGRARGSARHRAAAGAGPELALPRPAACLPACPAACASRALPCRRRIPGNSTRGASARAALSGRNIPFNAARAQAAPGRRPPIKEQHMTASPAPSPQLPPDDPRRRLAVARPDEDQSFPHLGIVGDTSPSCCPARTRPAGTP